ncbi:MAG: geranylgeranyl reductase family protein [Bacteroidota bacterium]|nr:geranylgeranyl reductase family protein [Bacteroidota bacterium]
MKSIIIIGGGPAGTSASIVLLKQGYDVILVDKCSFPRDKLCGGLLTGRAKRVYQEIFKTDFEQCFESVANGAGVYNSSKLVNEVKQSSEWFLTKRYDFDYFLLKKAKLNGLKTYLNDKVAKLDFNSKTLSLSSGTLLNYDYLIGADGVNSFVAKQLFGSPFNRKKIGLALEVELPKGLHKYHQPSIHFNIVSWGYGWVFPKKNSDTFGIVGLYKLNPRLTETFQKFHKVLYGSRFTGQIKGCYIPFGDFRKVPGRENVLLVGDAAGLVDALTGEGIAFAMESGAFAAQAIIHSISSGKDALWHYQKSHKKLAKELRITKRLAYFLYSPWFNRIFLKALPHGKILLQMHVDLMNEKISYIQFQRNLIRMAIRKVFQNLRFI